LGSTSFSEAKPDVGQHCDAQREGGGPWLEARVVGVDERSVKVHYLSFPSSMDEKVPRGSPRLLPRHTKVPDWRHQLKMDEELEVHRAAVSRLRGRWFGEEKAKSAWTFGAVRRIERAGERPRVLVRVRVGVMWNQNRDVWIPLSSEKIAPRFTHLAKPKPTAGSALAGGASPSSSTPPPERGMVGAEPALAAALTFRGVARWGCATWATRATSTRSCSA
jgi:hypothetical protein